VLAPLAVETGLKEPQAELGVQLQVTPALAVSFVTVAATLAVPPTGSDAGGAVVMVTTTDGGTICCEPPPQPARTTTATKATKRRRRAFLFINPPQRILKLNRD